MIFRIYYFHQIQNKIYLELNKIREKIEIIENDIKGFKLFSNSNSFILKKR